MEECPKNSGVRCLKTVLFFIVAIDLILGISYQIYLKKDDVTRIALETTIKTEPANAAAHLKLGVKFSQMGAFDQAIEEYEKTLDIDPANEKAHFNLGVRYFEKGILEKAHEHFSEVLKMSPNHSGAHLGLGVVSATQKQVNEALYHYQQLKRVNPQLAIKLFEIIS